METTAVTPLDAQAPINLIRTGPIHSRFGPHFPQSPQSPTGPAEGLELFPTDHCRPPPTANRRNLQNQLATHGLQLLTWEVKMLAEPCKLLQTSSTTAASDFERAAVVSRPAATLANCLPIQPSTRKKSLTPSKLRAELLGFEHLRHQSHTRLCISR